MASSFSTAWLAGDARALSFLPHRHTDPAARRAAVEAAATRRVPPAVLEAIVAQNARLPESAQRSRNIADLGNAGTVVVVTGQQVGLFLGPLYTLYKAASAIVDARALERETGHRTVPVFWLQTEDHDVAEVDHVVVPRATGEPLKVSIARVSSGEARVPLAHVRLGPGIADAHALVCAELMAHPQSGDHLGLLGRAYFADATYGDAFAWALAEIFADEGLVFVDPRDPALAAATASVHQRALTDASGIADALIERTRALEAAGFDAQVHVRAGAPLSFFSPDEVDGARYRLDPIASDGTSSPRDAWMLVARERTDAPAGEGPGASLTTAALLQTLEREPARFTTSALLRPLLQDTWLPTAAYVGGPAEMAYFAQLAPVYERFGIAMPIPVPRARFRVLDDRTRGLLDKLGLAADDVDSLDPEALLARVSRESANGAAIDPAAIERELLSSIVPRLEEIGASMAARDPSLKKAAARASDDVKDAITRLMGKYARALAHGDEVAVERVARLRNFLVPGGAPQERVYGLPYYACRFGTRPFVRLVLEAVEPFSPALKDLRP